MDNDSQFAFDVLGHRKDIIKQLWHEFSYPQCFDLGLVLIHRRAFGVLDRVREEWVSKGREFPSPEFQERVRLAFVDISSIFIYLGIIFVFYQAIVREGVSKYLI